VNAAPFGRIVEQRRVAVLHAILVPAADADRRLAACDLLEEVVGEGDGVVIRTCSSSRLALVRSKTNGLPAPRSKGITGANAFR